MGSHLSTPTHQYTSIPALSIVKKNTCTEWSKAGNEKMYKDVYNSWKFCKVVWQYFSLYLIKYILGGQFNSSSLMAHRLK